MEHLTKSQIVLLCLFVSFVSSMATGIVTVTLMQQAPEPVTQGITNVIERTIEKITPTIVEKPGKTVVLKDEDLMVAAIDRNNKSVVSFRVGDESGDIRSAGIGTIVSTDGLIITDKANLGGGVLLTTYNGVKYALEVLPTTDEASLLALGKLTPVTPPASTTPAVVFTPITLGDAAGLKVGQTAIVIAGRDGKSITTGLISSLDTHTTVAKDTKVETTILDNIAVSQRLALSANGAPIVTLGGVVVGFISINENTGSQLGVPAFDAKKVIDAYHPVAATPAQKTR